MFVRIIQCCLIALSLFLSVPSGLAQHTCNIITDIRNLESQLEQNEFNDQYLNNLSALGQAYYYNGEFDKSKQTFENGLDLLEEHQFSDTTKFYFLIECKNGFVYGINFDSLYKVAEQQFSSEHPISLIIKIQQTYNSIVIDKKGYNDSLAILTINKLKNYSRHLKYVALGQDYRSFHYMFQKDYEKTISILSENASFIETSISPCHKQLVRTLIRLGQRYVDNEMIDSSFRHYYKAEAIMDKYYGRFDDHRAQVKLKIGHAHLAKKEYAKAIPYLTEAAEVGEGLTSRNASTLTATYQGLGSVYSGLYMLDKAIEYSQKQMAISKQEYPPNSVTMFVAYHNIGNRISKLGDLELAEDYLNKAYEISIDVLGKDHLYTSINLSSMGALAQMKNEYDNAVNFYSQSLDISERINGKESGRAAIAHMNIGILNHEMGQLEEGLQSLIFAKEIFEAAGDQDNLFRTKLAASKIYQDIDERSKSMALLSDIKREINIGGNFESLDDPLFYLEVLQYELVASYKGIDTGSTQSIDKSISLSKEALDLFWWRFNTLSVVSDKSELMDSYRLIFDYSSLIYLTAYQQSKEQHYLLSSWSIAESAKNVSMSQAEMRRLAINDVNLPNDLQLRHSEIASSITYIKYLQRLAIKSNDFDLQTEYVDTLLSLKKEYADINTVIESDYPEFVQIAESNAAVDITLANLHDSTSVLIEYVLLEDRLLVYYGMGNVYDGKVYPISESTRSELRVFAELGIQPNSDLGQWKNIWGLLSSTIKNPVNQGHSLIIIPDKELALIPFEMLKVNGDYVLDQVDVSYEPSLTSILSRNLMSGNSGRISFCGFAPDYTDVANSVGSDGGYTMLVRSGMWELPYSSVEIDQIKETVGGKAYSGGKANKQTFLRMLNSKNVVHLSMHAIVDEASPINSRFIFDDTDTDDQNNLYLYELDNRRVASPLVVLSACETGRGQIHYGDGVQNFSNALLRLGIPSVLMSLWKVSDKSTSDIMISFYQNLNAGMRKDEALRAAKLEYLNNAGSEFEKHPFYWAGFVVVGDTSPVNFSSGLSAMTWGILGIVALFIMLLIRLKTRVAF